jgi:tetratricopeptide (TPR) repeat protein
MSTTKKVGLSWAPSSTPQRFADEEWYTLSENLYRAYLLTGEAKYRIFAEVWHYDNYWNSMADGHFEAADHLHAYSHVNTLSSAAMTYRVSGADAVTNFQKAVAFDPSDFSSKQALALCQERRKQYPEAERLLKEVVVQKPDLVSAHIALSRLYYKDHKKDEGDAEKKIVTRLEQDPR